MDEKIIANLKEQFTEQDDVLLKHVETIYKQCEDLTAIYSILKPRLPLPRTRGWAASPDILRKIMELVLINKPKLVVEASSGVSTLVVSYCLEQIGSGKVVSYENEAAYADKTRRMIADHNLSNYSTVIDAPLKEQEFNGQSYKWYDKNSIQTEEPIDMLIIDGPPGSGHKHARYPALPVFYDRLSPDAIVILDDASRIGELQILEMWHEQYPDLSLDYLHFEKGACILKKNH